MADQGRHGARAALALAENPGRFLSTVQIGITLVAILTGVFSGAALSEQFDAVLESWGVPTSVAEPFAYISVIGAVMPGGGSSDHSTSASYCSSP